MNMQSRPGDAGDFYRLAPDGAKPAANMPQIDNLPAGNLLCNPPRSVSFYACYLSFHLL
jgi:hypothetical protein